MNWTDNTGQRPRQLQDSDMVHIRLHNGREIGPIPVRGRAGGIEWRNAADDDVWRPFSIEKWRAA